MHKQSLFYRILKKFKILSNEKYENISLFGTVFLFFKIFFRQIFFSYCYHSLLLESLNFKVIRAKCWKLLGCKVGNKVCIGYGVSMDYGNSKLITIEDNVIITNRCTLLCHKRDLSDYHIGNNGIKLPYKYEGITLKKGCQLGINSTIMPGVTIGEGAIIGACSLVTKDIPDWTVAVGNPAKIVKQIKHRKNEDTSDNQ